MYGDNYRFVANCIYGFSILFFVRRYFKNVKLAYFIAVLPIILFLIAIYVFMFILEKPEAKFFILAIYSSHSVLLGIFLSFIAVRVQKKWLVIIPMSGLIFWYCFYGSDFLLHKSNFGTYFGEQNINVVNVDFLDENDKKVSLNDPNKYYVLDFWTTTCGVCIMEFPKVENLYQKYKHLGNVEIYSVNFPLRGQKYKNVIDVPRKRNMTFPVLQFENEDRELLGRKYNVFAFPTVLIIKNEKIIHVGNIDSTSKRLKKLTKK